MPSSRLRALARLSILASIPLSCAACAHGPPRPAILAALKCGPLIPDSYRQPVKSAPLPGPTAGELAAFGDSEAAKLELANQRQADTVAIVDKCDQRATELEAALQPPRPWWKIF